jgi:hypothetical protein
VGLSHTKHKTNLDCGLGTQEVFVWVCHTQNTKRISTAGWARRRCLCGLVTHKTQNESRLRVGHAGGVCVGLSHTKHKTNLDCGLGTQEGETWGAHTCQTSEHMQETVIHAYTKSDIRSKRKNEEFRKASTARKIVIRSEGRASQCERTSQFGHVKTEKRKNKRKTSKTGVRELKLACFNSMVAGSHAPQDLGRNKQDREKRNERKQAGMAVYEHKPDELKNVAGLRLDSKPSRDESKLILQPRTELRLSLVSPAKRGNTTSVSDVHYFLVITTTQLSFGQQRAREML